MTPLKDLFKQFQDQCLALPAFNIDSFEIYQAVEDAVIETKLPCIIQLSPNEDTFIKAERLFMLVRKANAEGLPIYLNMDHGTDVNRLLRLVKLGFDMVHFDGSKMDFQSCLATSQYFISRAKSLNPNVLIEVEFNALKENSQTDPSQAKQFIETTMGDLFAVSIGNTHGVSINNPEHLNISLLSEIHSNLPNTYLTLHGGSGIDIEQIKSVIKLGVVKININTDLRVKFKQLLKDELVTNSSEKIYDYLNPVISGLKDLIIQKLKSFTNA